MILGSIKWKYNNNPTYRNTVAEPVEAKSHTLNQKRWHPNQVYQI